MVRNNLTKARILLVEDEPLCRETIGFVLRRAGYHVDEAEDGDAALARFGEAQPDLVITDLIMPGLEDGLQTILALRRLDASVRILAISGGGTLFKVDCLPMAEKLGACRILSKPFECAKLLNAVAEALTAD